MKSVLSWKYVDINLLENKGMLYWQIDFLSCHEDFVIT